MLHYHESKSEKIRLDKKPLLSETKLVNFINKESEPIYVNECYLKMSKVSDSYDYELDENSNQIESKTQIVLKQTEESLCGIFVVSFDKRLGNKIDWQIPAHLNLENIEFKAMASGFHLIEKDVVYVLKLVLISIR
jgi:hypothetical protein